MKNLWLTKLDSQHYFKAISKFNKFKVNFPVNFAKFLRTTILKNICERLL